MKSVIIIILGILLGTQLVGQTSLFEVSDDEKSNLFIKAFENQSTSPSYLVFKARNLNTDKTKEICTTSTDLWFALIIENPNELNIDSLGKTYSLYRNISFKDTNALNRINFDNYDSQTPNEINLEITNNEQGKIIQYYNPNHRNKFFRIKRKYFNKLMRSGNQYFKNNIDSVEDTLVRQNLYIFKQDIIFNTYIDHVLPNMNNEQNQIFNDFREKWLLTKKIIDEKYYQKNPVDKYLNKYGIYFLHYLFNHGITESQDCLGGI